MPYQLTVPPQNRLGSEQEQTLAEPNTGMLGPLHQLGG